MGRRSGGDGRGWGGLGGAVVSALVKEGAKVWVPVRKRGKEAELRGVEYVEGIDLTDEGAVEGFYAKVGTVWGSVQAAGVFSMGKVETVSKGDFVSMMQGNLLSAFLCCREAVKRMKGKGGRIVNVGGAGEVWSREWGGDGGVCDEQGGGGG